MILLFAASSSSMLLVNKLALRRMPLPCVLACLQFAAAALGAHVIGLNTRYGVADVAHVLDRARPRVVLIAHDFLGLDLRARLRAAVAEAHVPAPGIAVVTGPGRPPADEAAAATYDVGAGAWVPGPPSDAAEKRRRAPCE